jgi:hypothetical protein
MAPSQAACWLSRARPLPVAAMSRIRHEEQEAIANGLTQVTVLRAKNQLIWERMTKVASIME